MSKDPKTRPTPRQILDKPEMQTHIQKLWPNEPFFAQKLYVESIDGIPQTAKKNRQLQMAPVYAELELEEFCDATPKDLQYLLPKSNYRNVVFTWKTNKIEKKREISDFNFISEESSRNEQSISDFPKLGATPKLNSNFTSQSTFAFENRSGQGRISHDTRSTFNNPRNMLR